MADTCTCTEPTPIVTQEGVHVACGKPLSGEPQLVCVYCLREITPTTGPQPMCPVGANGVHGWVKRYP